VVPARGDGAGLRGEYFDNPDLSGETVAERTDAKLEFRRLNPPKPVSADAFSVRWTGTFTAPTTGRHAFKLVNTGICRLYLDGKLLIETTPDPQAPPHWPVSTAAAHVELIGGREYDIKVEYSKPPEVGFRVLYLRSAFAPKPEEDDRMARAVELARQSDVAVIFGGMPQGYETEGGDRPNMELPGQQNELIRAVAEVNANTIVVLNCGSPVTMPWVDDVPAVVLAFYPGQEGGHAIADVLSGEVNPSGKLSVTFPKRYEDNPTFINYPGTREVRYGEGIFVGYRYYDKKDVEPLFPFGFGLSYTTFEYSDLQVPETVTAGGPLRVSVTVENTGGRAGKEVVQLYVHDRESSLARPPKELKGFQKVSLKPGESAVVSFTLGGRALSFHDPYQGRWVAEPGEFEILVGASSRDIRARAVVNLLDG
jgi:beta-glucosidase